jgi:hypothetical protein
VTVDTGDGDGGSIVIPLAAASNVALYDDSADKMHTWRMWCAEYVHTPAPRDTFFSEKKNGRESIKKPCLLCIAS